MKTNDPIVDFDLDAYVDGQLDLPRRIEVETYLSTHPAIAAKVMADLSIKGELRLALAGPHPQGRAQTREAARRLQATLSRGRVFSAARRVAAVAALLVAGWVANSHFGPFTPTQVSASVPVPAFVEEAVRAHQTTLLRGRMPSQPEAPDYDPNDIRSATAIVMPEIPRDWRVADVQIFPSAFGPSVEMAIIPVEGPRLSLFAVRPGSFAVQRVLRHSADGVEASYWQIGEVAYALVSDARPDGGDNGSDLEDKALNLFASLY